MAVDKARGMDIGTAADTTQSCRQIYRHGYSHGYDLTMGKASDKSRAVDIAVDKAFIDRVGSGLRGGHVQVTRACNLCD